MSNGKKELRQRKLSPGDLDKSVNDDEIVESCKVKARIYIEVLTF